VRTRRVRTMRFDGFAQIRSRSDVLSASFEEWLIADVRCSVWCCCDDRNENASWLCLGKDFRKRPEPQLQP
jgi:hypothetical protein